MVINSMRVVCNCNTFLPQRRHNGSISKMQRLLTHDKWLNILMSTTCRDQETRAETGCALWQRRCCGVLTEP
eukprot:13688116-Ditylum_brightwellii.AAC.2